MPNLKKIDRTYMPLNLYNRKEILDKIDEIIVTLNSGGGGGPIALNSSNIFVGNASNIATGVAMSGDISINNTGLTSIGIGKVTNTMLSGNIDATKLVGTDISIVGTITSGIWNGTPITDTYISSASIWNAKAGSSNNLSFFATTTSAQLAGVISDETGSGSLVFATSPTLVTPILGVASLTSYAISGTAGAGYGEFIAQSSNASAPSSTGFRLFASSTGSPAWAKKNGTDTFVRIFASTNTADRIYTWQDASYIIAGTDYSNIFTVLQTFSASNAVRVGNGSFSADNSALLISRANTGTINGHAIRDEGTNNSTTNADGYASFDAQYTIIGSSLYNHQAGFQARHIYNGSGSLGEWRGFWAAPNITGTGPTTDVKQFIATNPAGTGSITNNYGFYIEDLTRGTNNFAVYSIGTAPWFSGGQIRVGITANTNGLNNTDGSLSLRAVSGTNKQFNFGYNTTSNYGWMQAANFGTAFSPVIINANGGNVGIGTASTSALFHAQQAAIGTDVLRIQSTATNDDPYVSWSQARVTTTDATVTTLGTLSIAASNTYYVHAVVVMRRTGGASGTAEDGAVYELKAAYKTVSGVVTQIGTTLQTIIGEDQAGCDATFDISGTTVRVRVTGAASNNMVWHLSKLESSSVGT